MSGKKIPVPAGQDSSESLGFSKSGLWLRLCWWPLASYFMASPSWHTSLEYHHCIFFLFDRYFHVQHFCLVLLRILGFLAKCFHYAFGTVEFITHISLLSYVVLNDFLTSVIFCHLSPLWSLLLLESRTLKSFSSFLSLGPILGLRRLWWCHTGLFLKPFFFCCCVSYIYWDGYAFLLDTEN